MNQELECTNIYNKFINYGIMKYYDAGANINSEKAQNMINNLNYNYIATRKSDGEFCRIIKGENGQVIAQSRNISKVTGGYGDKTELIPHIISEFKDFPNGTVLLGELCFSDIHTTSRDVGTILRCKPDKAIARQKGNPLHFVAFDCLALDESDLSDKSFEYRFNQLKALMNVMIKNYAINYIQLCDYTENNFTDYLADILNHGGEGIVIHSKQYVYAPGKRPAWSTLKVKKTTGEIEVLVVSLIEPKRNYEGTERDTWKYWIGWYKDRPEKPYYIDYPPCADDLYNTTMEWVAVTKPYFYDWKNGIVVRHNGNLVNVASGLTDDDREWLASDEAYNLIKEGKLVAVISGMEITPDSIRHPRLIRLRTEA